MYTYKKIIYNIYGQTFFFLSSKLQCSKLYFFQSYFLANRNYRMVVRHNILVTRTKKDSVCNTTLELELKKMSPDYIILHLLLNFEEQTISQGLTL